MAKSFDIPVVTSIRYVTHLKLEDLLRVPQLSDLLAGNLKGDRTVSFQREPAALVLTLDGRQGRVNVVLPSALIVELAKANPSICFSAVEGTGSPFTPGLTLTEGPELTGFENGNVTIHARNRVESVKTVTVG